MDLSKPVGFRVPLEYRDKFESEAARLKINAPELAQRLVIRGLIEDELEASKKDFVLKNTAFITQLISEILDVISPEEAEQIRVRSQVRTKKIIETICGGNHG
ncbi:TPA: hypothetical protein P7L52_003273 [Vibrio cholerae]|nr:hypothetical protein [Vibrio cholerae]HDP8701226.1 hypothetical protein [Vibrio cholerae]